ncbi:FGGY-family carbohydrate kinase, partial [Escherichia coli]|uniref:FGGY-family carbohydrate kinase n=1 Tax=Escherichia coli TaxID=562 RepID=UPI00207C4861
RDQSAPSAAKAAFRSWLRIDGGMVTNDWIAQDLADILAIPVDRPDFAETTALGAAMLAGIGCGMFTDLGKAARMRGAGLTFEPRLEPGKREARLAGWRNAVSSVVTAAKTGAHLLD